MTITTTTRFGDRWDLLAYDLLGDAALAPRLMEANPHLIGLNLSQLPEGEQIVVPEVAPVAERITQVKAPWKG